jgi:hypothetical protein
MAKQKKYVSGAVYGIYGSGGGENELEYVDQYWVDGVIYRIFREPTKKKKK